MRGTRACAALAIVGALLSPRVSEAESPGERFVFAGSGTNLPVTRLLAEAFERARPDVKIEIPASLGSGGGVRAAAAGAITVGLISRPLTDKEKGLGLTVQPYARTAVVIAAQSAVADDDITFEELVSVYEGTKTRWRDGREIIVLTRQPGESSIEVLERAAPGFREAYANSIRAKRWTTLFTDQEMNRVLAKTPYALGLTDIGAVTAERLPIKALKVNGVAPTPENVASGAYPLVKTLACVFRGDRLPAGARAFLDFIRSKEAAKILAANGYLPGGQTVQARETETRIARRLAARLLPLSVGIAFLIGVGLPTAYYVFGVTTLQQRARDEAQNLAWQVGAFVSENPPLWKYETARHEQLIHYHVSEDWVTSVRILDEAGREIVSAALGAAEAWPGRQMSAGVAPIRFNNRTLGTVEVSVSRRALLGQTFVFFLLSATTGVSLALLAYRLPVRVAAGMEERIRELIETLQRANTDLEARVTENASLYQETKRAYDALARAQDQLLQARKMEAIGKLTGGIAHHFNNLLAIIVGRAELLMAGSGPDDSQRKSVELILKTANRATALTHQILAFSRKQMLKPRMSDLNAVVAGMDALLRRLIGEHIRLAILLEPALVPVKADPAQIEQVILNLAVNARDAMPQGGVLTIATANVAIEGRQGGTDSEVPAGRYAMLSVGDTGLGMDAETRAHLFEPFFTTKGLAQAMGMGLATVYGVVKQHLGHVEVDSEPGTGTTFRIYLPRADEPAADPAVDAVAGPLPRGGETILLVEDDDEVRELARDILQAQGYTVLQAGSPREALSIAGRHREPIHLLLSDVVMPEMSGRDLGERLGAERPALKILHMSGCTDDLIGHAGVLDPGVAFLEKPFTLESLTAKVREVLDAARGI